MASTALKTIARDLFLAIATDFAPTHHLKCQLMPDPDGNVRELVVEGKAFDKGAWKSYVQILLPSGGRRFEGENDNKNPDPYHIGKPISTADMLNTLEQFQAAVGNSISPELHQQYLTGIKEPLDRFNKKKAAMNWQP